MSKAEYAVVRYVGDSARNEPVNVGILIWSDDQVVLKLEEVSLQKVTRENPHLDYEALTYLEEYLQEEVLSSWQPSADFGRFLASHRLPSSLQITAPLYASYNSLIPKSLESTLEQLIRRLVRPRQRTALKSVGEHTRPEAYFADRFKSLMDQKRVEQNHFFHVSKSGIVRDVDFYANSGTDVVLDVLPLATSDARARQDRIDAQLGKIYDIREGNNINEYIVYCHVKEDEDAASVIERASLAMRSANARVVEGKERAATIFESLVQNNIPT